ncbi:hypothetical protein [Labrenzia sp. PHM005]|uniref:hypothetical protein n=1 Tax=Labrenzia sp. PHM005 TaxID=2590016 RepID=UPI0011408523|nr:hypothetical protein [Labrenzia sp. PHM005]QDG76722.1 hypothetical protein FJ695_13035 [Labrenzia sp. PHM005]
MFGALKTMMIRGRKTPKPSEQAVLSKETVPGLSRDSNGHLKPAAQKDESAMADDNNGKGPPSNSSGRSGGAGGNDGANASGIGTNSSQQSTSTGSAPSTSALNQQAVQAAEFSNYENADYAATMVATPPELMVGQTTGLAIQDAANYMNAIMQIAVAAQAVAIKKAAEDPALAGAEVPLLTDIQQMVTQAVTVYGTVSTTAGTSAKTVISDFKAGS